MKKVRLFASALALSILAACATSDSEMLKQARQIQDTMLKNFSALDSSLVSYTNGMNDKFAEMTADSTLMQDTLKLSAYMSLKAKFNDADALRNELADWKTGLKLLPTADEISKGAENPFGDKAGDQEILAAIKKADEEFSKLKSKVESAIGK